jgi:hypothetical protein
LLAKNTFDGDISCDFIGSLGITEVYRTLAIYCYNAKGVNIKWNTVAVLEYFLKSNAVKYGNVNITLDDKIANDKSRLLCHQYIWWHISCSCGYFSDSIHNWIHQFNLLGVTYMFCWPKMPSMVISAVIPLAPWELQRYTEHLLFIVTLLKE